MLTNLEINNGLLTPAFDIYNDTYTVTIEEDIKKLDIIYETENKDAEVIINGNENLFEDGKVVTLTIADGAIVKNIYLNVIVSKTTTTNGLQNYFEALEVKKQEKVPEYLAPLIGSACFLIIIIAFAIIFHKSKKLK